MSRKLPSLILPSGDYPLLLVCVSSDVVMISSREIAGDIKAFGGLVEESGAQVLFSSILPVVGNGIERNTWTQLINTWLQGWYHQ